MNFRTRLIEKIHQKKSIICVGIDPNLNSGQFPEFLKEEKNAKLEFAKMIIDEVCDLIPVVKPNTRFFLPNEWMQLKKIVDYAHKLDLEVIGDCKENDIGSTMSLAYEHQFEGFGFDAITVNGYFGRNGVIEDPNGDIFEKWYKMGKGLFVLVKTSNESSSELQDKIIKAEINGISCEIPVYLHIARCVEEWGKKYDYVIGAVVGATFPNEMRDLRNELSSIILSPGYGTQGGTAEAISYAIKKDHYCIVNSSRGIMYAYLRRFKGKFDSQDFAKASKKEVQFMNDDLNRFIYQFL